MTLIVYEDWCWRRFLPLTYVRPTCELTCGTGSLLERVLSVARHCERDVDGVWCRPLLAASTRERLSLPVNAACDDGREETGACLLLNGRGRWNSLPSAPNAESAWVGTVGDDAIACIAADARLRASLAPEVLLDEARTRAVLAALPRHDVSRHVTLFDWPWHLVLANPAALVEDWQSRDGPPRMSGRVYDGAYVLAPESVSIGEGATIKPCAVVDAEEGPVWIEPGATVMPHSYVQGPAYVGAGTLLQTGAAIRAGTTIGPRCKVGGEVEGSIVHGYSNKQHDGFLGHSYVAEWVNVAADCVNSDLKNTYGSVRVPINGREVDTGEMFVGMLVGDHSKAGINVSFPTGAVIGFCSSVFAARSPKFVPSFAWIDDDESVRYDAERGVALAEKVMARRNRTMSPADRELFLSVRQQALAIELQPQLQIDRAEPLRRVPR